MEYEIIRSSRKTLSLQIRQGKVLVRAPARMPAWEIEQIVRRHEGWIEAHLIKEREKMKEEANFPSLTQQELRALTDQARRVLPERVRFFAQRAGVRYGKITIRHQKTRWGSCSGKGNLSFNCLLMLAPPEVTDSVVVHELCHILEMNHSKRFYDEVLKVFPDYWHWNGWLKQNGPGLLSRIPRE